MPGVTLRNAIVRGYLASLAVLVAAVAVFTYGATEERPCHGYEEARHTIPCKVRHHAKSGKQGHRAYCHPGLRY